MENNYPNLKQYLLGGLTEPETRMLDLLLIEDNAFAEHLSLAESELVEEYLEGSLSDAETGLFFANFLISPEREALVRKTVLLKKYAARHGEQNKPLVEVESASAGFGDLIRLYIRPILAGAAIVAVVLVIGIVWQVYFSGRMSPLEKEYAELNKTDLTNLSSVDYSAVSLGYGNFRDGNAGTAQKSGTLTDTVLFRLGLPPGSDAGVRYKLAVLAGSTLIFTQNDLRSYQNSSGSEVRALVPKSILQTGRYQIKLENTAQGDQPLTFAFTIE